MKHFIFICIMFSIILIRPIAQAQTVTHPRVLQLEKTLSRDGLELLKGRFPDKPFLIKVKIDPMFRDSARRSAPGEKLPYLDLSEEEIHDEWDDPDRTSAELINRVRRIFVSVSVPSSLTDDEVSEIKDTLMSNLGMIAGRDEVGLNKRNWGAPEKDDSAINKQIAAWTAIGWVLFILALIGAAWFATSRLRHAMQETQKNPEKSAPAPAPVSLPAPEPSRRDRQTRAPSGGDISLTDPIKNRESLAASLRILSSHKSFPNLDDLLILQKFGKESPKELGALLSEFPSDLRAKVFGYSGSDFWLRALADPGEVTSACVAILNKCLRIQRDDSSIELQELLVLVWRLDGKISQFFFGLSQAEAFTILAGLPKSVSLGIAREVFPGSWGALLDPSYKTADIPTSRMAQLRDRALAVVSLRSMTAITDFRKQSDLLDYLSDADPATEREIYQVAGEAASLYAIRPPFFKIFELGPEMLLDLVPMMRIEEWAQALFNTDRGARRAIEMLFSEKQRYRYVEILKSFDGNPPPKDVIAEVREKAARFIVDIESKSLENALAGIDAGLQAGDSKAA